MTEPARGGRSARWPTRQLRRAWSEGVAEAVELVWVAFGETVLPIVVGVCTIVLVQRRPGLGEHPFWTAFVLYILLLVLTTLAAAGYDRWTPVIGGIVSLAVAIAVYIVLRRRRLTATRDTLRHGKATDDPSENTQWTTVAPVAMSEAERVRVVILALMSLTTVVGAAISPDVLGRVGFVLAAVAFGAAALWTPWQRRRGIAPTPPAAPTTTVAQRRAGNVTLAAFVALIALVGLSQIAEPNYIVLFVIGVIAVPVSSAVEKRWPTGNKG